MRRPRDAAFLYSLSFGTRIEPNKGPPQRGTKKREQSIFKPPRRRANRNLFTPSRLLRDPEAENRNNTSLGCRLRLHLCFVPKKASKQTSKQKQEKNNGATAPSQRYHNNTRATYRKHTQATKLNTAQKEEEEDNEGGR